MTKKNKKAILPEYAYEIIMDMTRNHNLDKREDLISEQLKNASISNNKDIAKSMIGDMPSLVLAAIAKKAAIEKLSEDEITSLIAEKLRLNQERAEPLMVELKKKLIFFIEVIEVDSEKTEEKEPSVKEKEIDDVQKKKKEKQEPDPYREPID